MTYNDVTVIGWVNGGAVTLPGGANVQLQNALNNSPTTCAFEVAEWTLNIRDAVKNTTDAAYASAWLLKHSANTAPPTTINPSQYAATGNYRLMNDYGSATNGFVLLGITPDPCATGYVPVWLEIPEASRYMGATGTSPSGMAYQVSEGRVGLLGSIVNLTLNNSLPPFIWSAIEFNDAGTPTYNNVAIFPTYSVYINGALVTSYPQSDVATFIAKGPGYQLIPSRIPCAAIDRK